MLKTVRGQVVALVPAKWRSPSKLFFSPFVHISSGAIVNPVSARSYAADRGPGLTLANLEPGKPLPKPARSKLRRYLPALIADRWLFEDPEAMFRAYRLRYVSLETSTVCNQRCYFCPVSEHTRPIAVMDDTLLARILTQVEAIPDFEGVFLNNYNEPFLDRRAGQIINRLHGAKIKVAVNSNGSVPLSKLTEPLTQGSIHILTFNLHTRDKERYRRERRRDHFDHVIANIREFAARGVARTTRIAVLGDMSAAHRAECEAIQALFADTPIRTEMFSLMDRAGTLVDGSIPVVRRDFIRGCLQTGSRPLEHLHVLPDGRCALCCEDYFEHYPVGDLNDQSIHEVMSGDRIVALRRQIYGFEEAAPDFICRNCAFSIPGDGPRSACTIGSARAHPDRAGKRP